MATIERVIDGVQWSVSYVGNVWWNTKEDRETCIERGKLTTTNLGAAKTAIALYEEWQQLKAQEDLDASPRVELESGWSWMHTQHGWRLQHTNSNFWTVPRRGSQAYDAFRFCLAAADELASRCTCGARVFPQHKHGCPAGGESWSK